MALKGLQVLEFAGLAPGPFCGMILADHGAKVIRIDNIMQGIEDKLCRGKKSIALNLKEKEGVEIVKKLSKISDILIEPYRPGIMEKLGIGPKVLMSENESLIYARLTGYGQTGVLSQKAGHDINYVAMSGVLSRIGEFNNQLLPPINFLADMAGGGMTCALGILLALQQRHLTGKGLVIDANMVEGCAYSASIVSQLQNDLGVLNNEKGQGILDGSAHFYRTYKTSDNRFIAVGALEPKFYQNFIEGLGLSEIDFPQYPLSPQLNQKIAKIFASKKLKEWTIIFEELDACVTPVLTAEEAANHLHNKHKNSFAFVKDGAANKYIPNPAPRIQQNPMFIQDKNSLDTKSLQINSNKYGNNKNNSQGDILENIDMPNVIDNTYVASGQNSVEILKEIGYDDVMTKKLLSDGIVRQANLTSKL